VISYTLYPEAMADVMAAETLRALIWTLTHVGTYGGDPSRVAVLGHSAGGHLGALALLMLAQLRADEEAAAAAAAAERASGRRGRAATSSGGSQQAAVAVGEGAAWAPGAVGGLPRVALFVGMSGVYHVARHHEYEMSR
jgi:hypothetical protein